MRKAFADAELFNMPLQERLYQKRKPTFEESVAELLDSVTVVVLVMFQELVTRSGLVTAVFLSFWKNSSIERQ